MTPLELIEELYRCFREKDFAGFAAICAPDLEWIQCAGFPGGGRHVGVEAVIEEVFKKNRSTWLGFAFQREEILASGDTVVVIGRYGGQHHKTGKSMEVAAVHVYDVRDGKVWRFRMIADTKPMWDAAT